VSQRVSIRIKETDMMTDAHPNKVPTTMVWSSPDFTARYTVQVISRNRPDSGRLGIVDRVHLERSGGRQQGPSRCRDGRRNRLVGAAGQVIISGNSIRDVFVSKRKRARA
jgi:hypothetical protein